ncbi:cyclin-dependent kinase 11B isoform X6 [Rhinatrema bivittatum]|uniref:cyclin-dependent kinase 11B isoform X6 n=1 Tax=Rhinatrema bivittatum TaxID=194408 RepID=UPI00112798CD|nr:cyclin-dependent kinase 11B isoform X6 [Rhinatrema bivittatum]
MPSYSKVNRNSDDRDSKRDSLEEGELRDHRMEITIRNSPYRREDSMEDRGEEDDSLAIKPPQQASRKEKTHHRKEEKRKEKRRHRSHSAEGGKHARVKEKEREHERRKRHREEQDKARREWERQKRREMAREHSRRERDRLEQLERKRERERKMREQQKEQKERDRRAEERRKEREVRREGLSGPALHLRRKAESLQDSESEKMQCSTEFPIADARILVEFSTQIAAHHRTAREEPGDKVKVTYRSHSPFRQQKERFEQSDGRRPVKEEKLEERDPLLDLQDISESERRTSSAETSSGSGSGTEEEEEETSSEESEEEEEEEEETGSNSEEMSEQSAEEVSEEEMSEEEERENGNHIPVVTESRFDHDSGESEDGEDDEEEDVGEVSPHSIAVTEGDYAPDSPAMSPIESKQELPRYLPALQGCRSVEEFHCLNRIEEGTYGVVYRARDKKTEEIVALKRLKMEKEKEGFPITSLREINTILKAQHPNIVTVREIVVGSNMDKIYIVMNYVEHDLKSLMETMKQPFLPGEVKTLMIQLLRGVKHLHDNWILHRDLKTSNLLLSHAGILKVGDFGLAREYGSPLKPYTPVVVTLWYRAPELLLGAKEYSTAIDMWSVGCIFGELLTQKPLFPGKSEIDQINKVFKDLGSPSEKIWPGYNELPAVKKMTFTEYPYNNLRKRFGALLSDQGFDLMNKFLTYCPARRINAEDGLKHEYFRESPLPIEPAMFPTWPAKSEQQRVKRGTSPRPPEGGLGYSQLGDDDLKDSGFHLTTTNQGASAAGPGFSLKF